MSASTTSAAPSASATAGQYTATPLPAFGFSEAPLKIRQIDFAPQPSNGSRIILLVALEGSADELEVLLYSKALVQAVDLRLAGPFNQGWNSRQLSLPRLPNGVYFVMVRASHGSGQSVAQKPARLMVLR